MENFEIIFSLSLKTFKIEKRTVHFNNFEDYKSFNKKIQIYYFTIMNLFYLKWVFLHWNRTTPTENTKKNMNVELNETFIHSNVRSFVRWAANVWVINKLTMNERTYVMLACMCLCICLCLNAFFRFAYTYPIHTHIHVCIIPYESSIAYNTIHTVIKSLSTVSMERK